MTEPGFDVLSAACVSRGVFGDVTGRWGALTLAALDEPAEGGLHRFGALRRRVDGISEKMLSQTLKALEVDGYVERLVHSTLPPHVDYRLTATGRTVAAAVRDLIVALYSTLDDPESAPAVV